MISEINQFCIPLEHKRAHHSYCNIRMTMKPAVNSPWLQTKPKLVAGFDVTFWYIRYTTLKLDVRPTKCDVDLMRIFLSSLRRVPKNLLSFFFYHNRWVEEYSEYSCLNEELNNEKNKITITWADVLRSARTLHRSAHKSLLDIVPQRSTATKRFHNICKIMTFCLTQQFQNSCIIFVQAVGVAIHNLFSSCFVV